MRIGPAHCLTQRLPAMIFEIADDEQRMNSATAEGRCPTLTAFKRFEVVPEF